MTGVQKVLKAITAAAKEQGIHQPDSIGGDILRNPAMLIAAVASGFQSCGLTAADFKSFADAIYVEMLDAENP